MTDQLTPQDMILVLDFGSPYSQILTRKIRELGVYSELWPNTTPIDDLQKSHIKGIILSGGLERSPYLDEQLFQLRKPVLGIASAMSSIAKEFGGKLKQIPRRGYEEERIRVVPEKRLFKNLPDEQTVWLGYEEAVVEAPEGFTIDAVSDHSPVVAFS